MRLSKEQQRKQSLKGFVSWHRIRRGKEPRARLPLLPLLSRWSSHQGKIEPLFCLLFVSSSNLFLFGDFREGRPGSGKSTKSSKSGQERSESPRAGSSQVELKELSITFRNY